MAMLRMRKRPFGVTVSPWLFRRTNPKPAEFFQIRQFVFEVAVERDAEHTFVNPVVEREAAHQILNDIAAQDVVLIELITAHDGQSAFVDGGIVGIDVAFVLGIGAADFADGRHADGDQIAIRVGRIALEVALEEAFFEGDGEFVVRFGEMIHADEDVAAFG